MDLIDINDKFKILNEVIEDLPIDYIRQIKINYDTKIISIIFIENLNNNNKNKKLVFNNLKYDNYQMQDIYYLVAKLAHLLTLNNFKINYYSNYNKNGYNIFINQNMIYSLFIQDDDIIIEYFNAI